MKYRLFPKSLAAFAAITLLSQPSSGWAAEETAASPAVRTTETPGTPAPLSPAANEVLKLVHAKIADDTIVAFIGSSTTSYHLSAAEIISLRTQGVSDQVLTAMLARRNSERPAPRAPVPTSEAPQVAAERPPTPAPAPGQTVYPGGAPAPQPAPTYVQAAPTYVQTVPTYVPAPTVYYSPAPYYSYYPYGYGYGGYGYRYGIGLPALSFSFGFGGHGHGHR